METCTLRMSWHPDGMLLDTVHVSNLKVAITHFNRMRWRKQLRRKPAKIPETTAKPGTIMPISRRAVEDFEEPACPRCCSVPTVAVGINWALFSGAT